MHPCNQYNKYSHVVWTDRQAGDWCGCGRADWMDGTDHPDEVRKQGSGCTWPSWSPIKPSIDIKQQNRLCEQQLNLWPRRVTCTLLAFTTSSCRQWKKKKRKKKSLFQALLHIILSLCSDKARASSVWVRPSICLLRWWAHDPVSVGPHPSGSPCEERTVRPFKSLFGDHISCLKIWSPESIHLWLLSIN